MISLVLSLLKVTLLLLSTYRWALIIYSLLGWLTVFNIINPHNQFVYMVNAFLSSLIEPVVRPIRSRLPAAGGIDISYLVLYLSIYFFEYLISLWFNRLMGSGWLSY